MKKIELIIKPINQDDFSAWEWLYKQYLEFYNTELSTNQLTTLWSWFFDTDKQMHCYKAIHENKIIGLVHFREYLRPIKAASAIFIDDLYVDSAFRGRGIAQSLIQSVNDYCLTKKIPLVRWITAHDNQVAMKLYDKIATQTQWKIYDMVVTRTNES
jgi:ribosomal protein S18 acetylase RimI-like enzyme